MTDIDISAAAAALGRKGGKSRSAAKLAAVRANGRKGGRPNGSKDKDTPERLQAAWDEWLDVTRIAKARGYYHIIHDVAPLANANVRSIRIRTAKLAKLLQ